MDLGRTRRPLTYRCFGPNRGGGDGASRPGSGAGSGSTVVKHNSGGSGGSGNNSGVLVGGAPEGAERLLVERADEFVEVVGCHLQRYNKVGLGAWKGGMGRCDETCWRSRVLAHAVSRTRWWWRVLSVPVDGVPPSFCRPPKHTTSPKYGC